MRYVEKMTDEEIEQMIEQEERNLDNGNRCPECGSLDTGGDFQVVETSTPTLRGSKTDYDASGYFICNDCGFEDEV